jgi:hypothetical protein
MTVDYNGVAVVIGAVAAAIASIATTVMQWRASKKADANKQEAIAAREHQTSTIIQSAVAPALATDPSTLPQPVGAPHPNTNPAIVAALQSAGSDPESSDKGA